MNSLQNRILDIFKEIKIVLEKNGINYFAIGGTCIGAVRHKGFIPWDDDLDIAVPIEQFDFMIEKLKTELPNYLSVYTGREIRHYRYIFIKVVDLRTTYIEKSEFNYQDAYKGVYVDIMPLAGICNSKQYLRHIKFYFRANIYKRLPSTETASALTEICKKVLSTLPVKYNFFSKNYMRFLKRYPLSTSDYTGYVWWSLSENLIFKKEYFKDFILFPFEDTYIRCPIGYDMYLKKQFGDYMTWPSEKERQGHHYALIKLNTPYSYYQNNPQCVLEDYKDE